MITTKVVNKYKERFDVYIGRGSLFGNPYTVKGHGREKAIELYRKYFNDLMKNKLWFYNEVLELKGKTLGCFCKPQACHGDIIADYLNKKEQST